MSAQQKTLKYYHFYVIAVSSEGQIWDCLFICQFYNNKVKRRKNDKRHKVFPNISVFWGFHVLSEDCLSEFRKKV